MCNGLVFSLGKLRRRRKCNMFRAWKPPKGEFRWILNIGKLEDYKMVFINLVGMRMAIRSFGVFWKVFVVVHWVPLTLSSSQNFACRLKQNFLFNFNGRLVSFDRLIFRLIIEFPCWIRFWQRWGQRKDVEESLGKVNLKVAAETPRWHFLTTLTIEMLDIALICW